MTAANESALDAIDEEEPTAGEEAQAEETSESTEQIQVWMVDRTYSQDCPHIMVINYATEDGSAYLQQERAVPSFNRAGVPEVTAAMDVSTDRLAPVEDEETRERYATEAERMQERHDPDDVV